MTQTLTRPDADLKRAVLEELQWIAGLDSTHINVDVVGAAATLTGEVGSYPEKLLAAKAAQRVHGVLGVAQEIVVRGSDSGVSDTDIAREAGRALIQAIDVPRTVTVVVHDHDVTLSGEVTWHYQRKAALRVVQYLHGVRNVYSAMSLRPGYPSIDLKADIEAALLRNVMAEGDGLTVATDADGVVTLTGRVDSWHDRQRAENVCWAASGVFGVTNELRIADR